MAASLTVPRPTVPELPARYAQGMRVRTQRHIALPPLPGWNGDITLLPHQTVGATWLYVAERGILGDQMGLGKSFEALAASKLAQLRGEPHRTLIVTTSPNQQQWREEAQRACLDWRIIAPHGTREERLEQYFAPWDVCITTYPLLLHDYLRLRECRPLNGTICYDESGTFRHHNTKTAQAAKQLSHGIPRIYLLDGTPIQNNLLDIHSQLEALHVGVFQEMAGFMRRYVRTAKRRIQKGDRVINQTEVIGYKNVDEFAQRLKPFLLRRTHADVGDALPEVVVLDIWLELPRAQRQAYEQAKRGVVSDFLEGRRRDFRAHYHHLQYAADSTGYFNDPSPRSVKLDWLMERVREGGDLYGESLIVFSRHKGMIQEAGKRLRELGIHYGTYTGDDSQEYREELKAAFNDGRVQVILGTEALERGLNLQRSAYLIALNQIPNPQRMSQLLGRIRRLGSQHAQVFAINLRCRDTFEEHMAEVLAQRAAVSDYVFGETSELFASLTDEQLFALLQSKGRTG